MTRKKAADQEHQSRPATSPEAREQQLTNLAVNLAEKQLLAGTAAPSVINHFLKLATQKERLERERLEQQSKLLEAKVKSLEKEKEAEKTAKEAIEAMKQYSGGPK